MQYPENIQKINTGRSSLSDWLSRNYAEFYDFLCSRYNEFDIKESLYMFYHNIDTPPLCPLCGKPTKFHGYKYGYSKYCGSRCARLSSDSQIKYNNTCEIKYGSIDKKNSIVKEKSKQTCIDRYGVDNPMKVEEFKTKLKQTCIDRYGVDNPMKVEEFKEKSAQTFEDRYGDRKHVLTNEQREQAITRSKQTCVDRYGVESVMQCDTIKEKVNNTCLERYGVNWNCMRPEAHNSRNKNSSCNVSFMNMLDDNNITYDREFVLGGYVYDFKVSNTLIEINPYATHNINWNPFGGKIMDKMYHHNKTQIAKENGYNLIHIWDWDDTNKIIKMLTKKDVIFARCCDIKEVSKKESDIFLNKYHLQNTCKGQSVRLGLYYDNELVEIMTFGRPRYNKKYEYELLRLCTSDKYIVTGGSQKLFKYFINKWNPLSIISYCDNSKFNGDVYLKLGFELHKQCKPSRHWYHKDGTHITDNLLRSIGFDKIFKTNYGKGVSNDDLMRDYKFVEIYDAGQNTWVYVSKKNK